LPVWRGILVPAASHFIHPIHLLLPIVLTVTVLSPWPCIPIVTRRSNSKVPLLLWPLLLPLVALLPLLLLPAAPAHFTAAPAPATVPTIKPSSAALETPPLKPLLVLLLLSITALLCIRRLSKRLPLLLLLPAAAPAPAPATSPSAPATAKSIFLLLLLLLELPWQGLPSSNQSSSSCVCGPCSDGPPAGVVEVPAGALLRLCCRKPRRTQQDKAAEVS
jgi:hypothetical protein